MYKKKPSPPIAPIVPITFVVRATIAGRGSNWWRECRALRHTNYELRRWGRILTVVKSRRAPPDIIKSLRFYDLARSLFPPSSPTDFNQLVGQICVNYWRKTEWEIVHSEYPPSGPSDTYIVRIYDSFVYFSIAICRLFLCRLTQTVGNTGSMLKSWYLPREFAIDPAVRGGVS